MVRVTRERGTKRAAREGNIWNERVLQRRYTLPLTQANNAWTVLRTMGKRKYSCSDCAASLILYGVVVMRSWSRPHVKKEAYMPETQMIKDRRLDWVDDEVEEANALVFARAEEESIWPLDN